MFPEARIADLMDRGGANVSLGRRDQPGKPKRRETEEPGYFIKLDKIWLFIGFNGAAQRGLFGEKGQPGRPAVSRTVSKTRLVASGTRFSGCGSTKGLAGLGWLGQNSDKNSGQNCDRGSVQGSGEGAEGAPGRAPGARRVGLPWRQRDRLAPRPWLEADGGATERVDLWLDGRGRGLRPGWRKATVIHGSGRDQAFMATIIERALT